MELPVTLTPSLTSLSFLIGIAISCILFWEVVFGRPDQSWLPTKSRLTRRYTSWLCVAILAGFALELYILRRYEFTGHVAFMVGVATAFISIFMGVTLMPERLLRPEKDALREEVAAATARLSKIEAEEAGKDFQDSFDGNPRVYVTPAQKEAAEASLAQARARTYTDTTLASGYTQRRHANGDVEYFTEAPSQPKCPTPPEGWDCSRDIGHPGPCAASPSKSSASEGGAL